MSRFARKVDANQAAIVLVLRSYGATVQSLASVGCGCPDLLVGYKGLTVLLEVKDGQKPPSARKLTPLEETWARQWQGGPLRVATSVAEALRAVGVSSTEAEAMARRAAMLGVGRRAP